MQRPVYDVFQSLAMRANPAAAVLSNPDGTATELLPVMPRGLSNEDLDSLVQLWAGRGLAFIGVIGMVDGIPQTALDIPLDPLRMHALSSAFVRHCEQIERQKGDSVEWCERLFALPDPRPYPRAD